MRCVFGLHRPSLVSVARKGRRLEALCEGCGSGLERAENGRWTAAIPLVAQAEPLRKSA